MVERAVLADERVEAQQAAVQRDDDRQRMGEVEAVVIENNVTEFVLARAQVTAKVLPFDELMSSK